MRRGASLAARRLLRRIRFRFRHRRNIGDTARGGLQFARRPSKILASEQALILTDPTQAAKTFNPVGGRKTMSPEPEQSGGRPTLRLADKAPRETEQTDKAKLPRQFVT